MAEGCLWNYHENKTNLKWDKGQPTSVEAPMCNTGLGVDRRVSLRNFKVFACKVSAFISDEWFDNSLLSKDFEKSKTSADDIFKSQFTD